MELQIRRTALAAAPQITDARGLLLKAGEAAARRDPAGMLEALFESRFLDGLCRRLRKQWGHHIPPAEIDDCVAVAVDAAYEAAARGKSAKELGAWLWKVASNTANDRWRNEYRNRAASSDEFPEVPAHRAESEAERKEADALADTPPP